MMRKQVQQEEILQTIAKNIRDRRKLVGLTQEQLAEKADLSTNYVARLELGKYAPSLATLIDLSRALNVQVSDLLKKEIQHTWQQDAEEIAKSLEQFDKPDVEFILAQLRSVIRHLASRLYSTKTKDDNHPL